MAEIPSKFPFRGICIVDGCNLNAGEGNSVAAFRCE